MGGLQRQKDGDCNKKEKKGKEEREREREREREKAQENPKYTLYSIVNEYTGLVGAKKT